MEKPKVLSTASCVAPIGTSRVMSVFALGVTVVVVAVVVLVEKVVVMEIVVVSVRVVPVNEVVVIVDVSVNVPV